MKKNSFGSSEKNSFKMACMNCNRMTSRKKQILRVIFDVVCVILVSAGIFAIKFGTKPYHRGFFCDDESIQHPVLSDTVSVPLCGSIGVLLPVAVIILTEFLSRNSPVVGIITVRNYSFRNKSWLIEAYTTIAAFIFGMAVTQFLTEIGKYSVGRLRPHFLTLCKPDTTKFDCSSGYIEADVCTSTDTDMMTEARLSFPSGHSSFSMYCMMYLILYLQARISCQVIVLLKPLAQLILFSLGFFTCLSRISDYKHHWSDVLGGAVLGTVICILTVLTLPGFGKVFCGRGQGTAVDDETLVQSGDVTTDDYCEGRYNSTGSRHGNPSSRESSSQIVMQQQIEV